MKKHLLKIILLANFGLNNIANAQAPNWQWAISNGGSDKDYSNCVSIDASGNLIIVGRFYSSSITFGSTTLNNANPGIEDLFIVKYDQAGTVIWAKSAGGINGENASEVTADAFGNLIVVGHFFSPTITFDAITLNNAGNSDMFIVKYDPAGNVLWAKKAGGSDFERSYTVTTDSLGNIIAAGFFNSSSITFGSSFLTNASSGNSDMFIVKYSPTGSVLWARSAGGSDDDVPYSVNRDGSGNLIVTGFFDSPSVAFVSATLTNVSSGNSDMFIVKYDQTGNEIWAKSAGGNGSDQAYSLTTNVFGDIIVVGDFDSPTITFGSTTLNNVNSGNHDMFIVKYDQSGAVLWAQSAGGNLNDGANPVTADTSGNITVAGYFLSPTITFGSATLTNVGSRDIFIVKYDQAGSVLWAKSAGGTNDDYSTSITTDSSGNLIVTGYFKSPTITFSSTILTTSGVEDMFIAKLNSINGLEDIKDARTFIIAPNPFTSQTTICFAKEQINTTIKIIDVLGKEIKSINFSGKQLLIDKGEMQKGIYFVQTIDEKRNIASSRIVIQ